MSRGIHILWGRSRLACLTIILIWALSLSAHAQEEYPTEPSSSASRTSNSLLSRKTVVPLKVAQQFFPDLTRQDATGENSTAIGVPIATRMVVYANKDGARKVTLSVDQYGSPADASSAYKQAAKSSEAPQFEPVAVANVGQSVFASTLGAGAETRVALGTLQGTLLVGATLAGYDATTENIGKLIELARTELAEAKAHVSARRRR